MNGTDLIQELSDRAQKIGLTRLSICKQAGVAPPTFRRWVDGKTIPRYQSLLDIKRIVEDAESALKVET